MDQELDNAIDKSIQNFVKATNGSEVRLAIYEYEELMFMKSKSMKLESYMKAESYYRSNRHLAVLILILSILILLMNILRMLM